MSIYGHYEKNMVPNVLLLVSVQELHNIVVVPLEEGGRKRRDTNKIIVSLEILPYVTFLQLSLRILLHITRSGVVASIAYLTKLCIDIYYNIVIFVWKNLNTKATLWEIEGLVKRKIIYLKNITLLWCHMVVIFNKRHLPWL